MIDSRQIAAEYRLAHWAEIMRERHESGLNIRAYCERMGIEENTYFYWQRKLRLEAQQVEKADAIFNVRQRFVEALVVEPTNTETAAEAPTAAGRLQIESHGLKITADEGYPVASLLTIVQLLLKLC